MTLDWWRCWRCSQKTPETEVEWRLTGPKGARAEPYCAKCAPTVELEEQHYPGGGCAGMPTFATDGRVVCSTCGVEYQGDFHP